MRLAAAALLALAAIPPASALADAPDPTFQATLRRGPCMGTCANYSVSIDAGGKVTFSGSRPSRGPAPPPCPGTQTWRIPLSSVTTLRDQLDRADFFALKDSYRGGLMDVPTFSVTVTRGGRTKTVVDRAGEMAGMPKSVHEIEAAIDKAAGDDRCLAPR